jgi:transposase-like protein
VVAKALVVAQGVHESGRREILLIDVGEAARGSLAKRERSGSRIHGEAAL